MSSNVYVALLSVLIMSAIIGGMALLTYLYFRLWRKGYRSPLVVLGIAAPSLVGFFLGLVLFYKYDRLANTVDNTFDPSWVAESFVNFALYWIGPPLITILATALVVALLPRRAVRRFGTRQVRFPWRKAGYALVVLAGLLLLFDWGFGWHVIKSTRIVTQVLLPTYVFCLWMSRRAEAPAMADVFKVDPRPPVLYLRAFENEAEVFAELTVWELGTYAPYIGNKIGVTLEQYLEPSISQEIGPFIGLGSPEDYLPPEGAARMYADDKDWTQYFEKLSRQAACVIMEVDQSENLRWELQSLSSNQLHHKLFILTRPPRKKGWRYVRIHLGRAVMWYIAKCKGVHSASWAEFVQALGSTGYKLEMTDPGPGAVIAFDSEKQGIVIRTGAVTPTDFVAPIKQWMEKESSPHASLRESKERMAAALAGESPAHVSSDDHNVGEIDSLSHAAPQVTRSAMKVVQRFFVAFIVFIGFFLVFSPFLDRVSPEEALLVQKFISVMGGTVVVIVLGLGVLLLGTWLRGRLLYLLQAQNDRSAHRVMSELRADPGARVPEFYLYLRAFETTGRLHMPLYLRLRKLSTGLQSFVTNDLESYISTAVRRIAPLIALGHPGETIGAGRIVTEDANWTVDIVTLMKRSKAILLVPSSQPGTLWEIETLKREGLLGKVMFIMPPRTKGDFDTKQRWDVSRQVLNNHGLEAPEHQKRGLLFEVGPDGRVSNVEPLLVNMRKSMKRILSDDPPKGGLFKAIAVAVKRNRRATFWGWAETLRQLSPYAIAAAALFVGHPEVGFDPSESWATVFSRFYSAKAISDHELVEYMMLAKSEKYRALLARVPEEKLRSELSLRGLVRLKDENLRDYFMALGDMLVRGKSKTCAAITQDKIPMRIAFTYIPEQRIYGFLRARTEAILAGLEDAPFTPPDEQAVEKASEQFLANLSPEGRQRYERITQIQGKPSDDDQCWLLGAMYGGVATLAEPHASVWARMLASMVTPTDQSTVSAPPPTSLDTSGSPIAQFISTTSPPPSSVASSSNRQDLLQASTAEADEYEAAQEWPRAIAAYARLQKAFPETEVGRVRLELLLSKIQSEPGALREESFDTLRDSLTEAAKLDLASAMELLGDFLRERDPKASFDWLCAAAAHGRAHAMSEVGLRFSNGKGVARDFVKAAEWFELARQAGDVSGGTLLAECYLFGKGVPKNETKAVNLLKNAAAANDPRAMDQLGNCYHKGIGVARDDREAFLLFESAAKLNYLDSIGNLGVIYLTSPETDLGKNKVLRTQMAVGLFREGAKHNNALCMYLYARCFEDGVGVKASPSEASDWYRRAAEAGNQLAKDWCRQHNIVLTTDQVP